MRGFPALGLKGRRRGTPCAFRDRCLSFPGWEFYANAGAEKTLFDLLPNAVFIDKPTAIEAEQEHWWKKLSSATNKASSASWLLRKTSIFRPMSGTHW